MATSRERAERTDEADRTVPMDRTDEADRTPPAERTEPADRRTPGDRREATTRTATRREVDVTDSAVGRSRPPMPPPVAGNGAGIASFVTGLLSATFGFLVAPALAAVVFGVVAIVLGVKGLSRAKALGGMHKGLSVTGIVSGVLGLLLGVVVIVGGITLWNELEQTDLPNQIQELID